LRARPRASPCWRAPARCKGVFAALLAPSALSLLTTTFTDPRERGTAFGIFGALAGGGGALGLLLGGVLTEYLSWRWCLYVNVIIAVPAIAAGLVLLTNQVPAHRPKFDLPGTLAVSAGLFLLVYGFSQAEPRGWGDPVTLCSLAAGVLLLAVFVAIERRSAHPLLPLRIVLDRNRGGSYLSVLISGAGVFAVFLFLTFYLQNSRGYSPVTTGVAFLPMVGAIVIMSTSSNAILLSRVGPRPLVTTGMLLAAGGMLILTQLGVQSSYAGHILPALLVTGLGLGLIFAPAISTATLGVEPADAGVASATVNSCQQVGGSIGTAFLNTLAITANRELPQRQGPDACGRRPGRAAWLHGRVLVGGRHLRRGCPGRRPAAAPRCHPSRPQPSAGDGAGVRRGTRC